MLAGHWLMADRNQRQRSAPAGRQAAAAALASGTVGCAAALWRVEPPEEPLLLFVYAGARRKGQALKGEPGLLRRLEMGIARLLDLLDPPVAL